MLQHHLLGGRTRRVSISLKTQGSYQRHTFLPLTLSMPYWTIVLIYWFIYSVYPTPTKSLGDFRLEANSSDTLVMTSSHIQWILTPTQWMLLCICFELPPSTSLSWGICIWPQSQSLPPAFLINLLQHVTRCPSLSTSLFFPQVSLLILQLIN